MENIELKLKINLETLPDLETALKKNKRHRKRVQMSLHSFRNRD